MDLTPLRQRLLTALAGDPEGAPPWVLRLSEGDDAGYFPENGAAWTVHAGTATLIAGIRALLVQALHPGALAGVHDFSRYREDPLGRLAGTVRWVICVTYGSTEQADAETARVGRFHQQVKGTYQSTEGRAVAYSAADAELVEWVHLAFADAFLTSHRTYGGPIPGGPDAYVAEWATAGRLMRVKEPPRTADELARALESYRVRGILQGGPRVDDVVRFLRRPPVGGGMALGYRLFFAAAVATIPKELRRLLGLRRSVLPVVTLTRAVLPIVARVLESGGPRAHDRAHERIRRVRSNASG